MKPAVGTIPAARRPDLVLRPHGDGGGYVVKVPRTGEYFKLGAEAHFLLTQLDGTQTRDGIRAAFAERFGEPLSDEDLDGFVQFALRQGVLLSRVAVAEGSGVPDGGIAAALPHPSRRQSTLHWRKNLFDPDRLFTLLAPRLWFFWTRTFLLVSAGSIVAAALLVWLNRDELVSSFAQALRWETALWVWFTLFLVTLLHEFAHGLTCKHYGGEVHEVGFLFMYLMPCFYCNVSDAWLFREKSKRLWVTFAGGYFELVLWSLAVLVWRLALPGTLPHYLAFVVASACGVGTLFNFNPLLKLDGYYLLSDWGEIPNLQQRAWDYWNGHMRWLLWGAPRPVREPRGRFLLRYGLAAWLYSLVFLALAVLALYQFLGTRWGLVGLFGALLLGVLTTRSLLRGVSAGEVRKMITMRHKRTAVWALVLGSVAAVLCLVQIEDRVGGPCRVRPATRAELRAPVAGFLREVCLDQGDRVSPGALVARLEVPDLTSRTAQKRAEVREVQAKLRLLEAGPRPEEVLEQRRRVERARSWRDLAEQDLLRARQAHEQDLTRLDKEIAQCDAELDYARDAHQRAVGLVAKNALAREQYHEAEKKHRVSQAHQEQVQAEKRARQAQGTLVAEMELARREKELADAQGVLALLEAGTRPEEIDAERARLARLQEEARYLEGLQEKLLVSSPVPGLITTARLHEKVGQYFQEGELIGEVKEPSLFEAEIAVREQAAALVRCGQSVKLKVRALPYESFIVSVDRVAPSAELGEVQSTVSVYCRLAQASSQIRPEMSGYARIYCGRRSVGAILADRALRYLRTEFWFWW